MSGIGTAYRKDIDGLRGIAVLLVVGYHAFPTWIKSGFIGVDVFFVISGFLITGILLSGMDGGAFRFSAFYERRIKRLFPALAVVLVASFAFGRFALFPDEHAQLAKQIAGGAGFASNFVLWKESGYFDSAADTKPLLHLWSLAIEEQFYLVWPLMLWLTRKRRLGQFALCVSVMAVSFAINLYTVHVNPTAAFYSPLSRFWELMVGGLLACLERNSYGPALAPNGSLSSGVAATAGAVFIGLGTVAISPGRPFPGLWALLPTVGAGLILSAGPHAWLNRGVLSNRVTVLIGRISYPLYLWHWPLLSFARIIEADAPSRALRMALVLVSTALAWLTFRLIETPIRFGLHGKLKAITLCAMMGTIGGVGFYSWERNGLPSWTDDKVQYHAFFSNAPPEYKYATAHHLFEAYRAECDFYDNKHRTVNDALDASCYTPRTDRVLFIWGDSHAQHLFYGLNEALPRQISILQVATSGCTPSVVDRSPDPLLACNKSNTFALKIIAATRPQTVLLAQQGAHMSTDFEAIAARLLALGVHHVLVAGPVPQWKRDLYKVILNDFWPATPRRSFHALREDVFETDSALKARYSGSGKLTYISLTDFFCNAEGCLLYLGSDKRDGIVTFDYGHLLPGASELVGKELLAPMIVETFQR